MRQDYKTENLFPIRCFSFKASKDLLKQTLDTAKNQEYRSYNGSGGVGTTDDIQHLPEFSAIHNWFQHCIDTLHVDNGWNCDRIVINKSWINRSDGESGHHHTPHRHPMSYLSGIFYLTEGAPTIFVDPIAQREWAQLHLDGGPIEDSTQFIHPIAGGLFLFPSYLIHSSDPNYHSADRFSIAFNTFPQGDVNLGGWGSPMLKVKVDGWSDLGPLKLSDYS